MAGGDAAAVSRIIQGLVTGVGFIGAGVILHHDAERRVVGLTTAASIWVAAALGSASGTASWSVLGVGLVLTLAVLVVGGPIERAWERRLRPTDKSAGNDATRSRAAHAVVVEPVTPGGGTAYCARAQANDQPRNRRGGRKSRPQCSPARGWPLPGTTA